MQWRKWGRWALMFLAVMLAQSPDGRGPAYVIAALIAAHVIADAIRERP